MDRRRTVVLRTELDRTINVNDEIGLEAYSSYTLAQHLHDLEENDGLVLIDKARDVYMFEREDGSREFLLLRQERQPLSAEAISALPSPRE